MTNNGFINNVLPLFFLSVSAPPSSGFVIQLSSMKQQQLCCPVLSWNILASFNTSPCCLCSVSVFTQTDVISRPRLFSAQSQWRAQSENYRVWNRWHWHSALDCPSFWIVQCRYVVDFHLALFRKVAQNTGHGFISKFNMSCFIMTWHCLRKTCSQSKHCKQSIEYVGTLCF